MTRDIVWKAWGWVLLATLWAKNSYNITNEELEINNSEPTLMLPNGAYSFSVVKHLQIKQWPQLTKEPRLPTRKWPKQLVEEKIEQQAQISKPNTNACVSFLNCLSGSFFVWSVSGFFQTGKHEKSEYGVPLLVLNNSSEIGPCHLRVTL